MMNSEAIKPHLPVVCSKNKQFATFDHVEGQRAIKLTKDASGQHHFIPLSWVTTVDDTQHPSHFSRPPAKLAFWRGFREHRSGA